MSCHCKQITTWNQCGKHANQYPVFNYCSGPRSWAFSGSFPENYWSVTSRHLESSVLSSRGPRILPMGYTWASLEDNAHPHIMMGNSFHSAPRTGVELICRIKLCDFVRTLQRYKVEIGYRWRWLDRCSGLISDHRHRCRMLSHAQILNAKIILFIPMIHRWTWSS